MKLPWRFDIAFMPTDGSVFLIKYKNPTSPYMTGCFVPDLDGEGHGGFIDCSLTCFHPNKVEAFCIITPPPAIPSVTLEEIPE